MINYINKHIGETINSSNSMESGLFATSITTVKCYGICMISKMFHTIFSC